MDGPWGRQAGGAGCRAARALAQRVKVLCPPVRKRDAAAPRATAEVAGSEVRVTSAADFVGTVVVRYRVQDATGDADREVDGRTYRADESAVFDAATAYHLKAVGVARAAD